jgi:hypothetical protein
MGPKHALVLDMLNLRAAVLRTKDGVVALILVSDNYLLIRAWSTTQVHEERRFKRPSVAKLRSCNAKARALLVATARVAHAAAALRAATGCELQVAGQPYPGAGALGSGHLARFCDEVTAEVAELTAAQHEPDHSQVDGDV